MGGSESLKDIAAIAGFGLFGVFSRYFLDLKITKMSLSTFPVSTFVINIAGSFLIGIIYVLGMEKNFFPRELRLGIMVGLLGGFTTFSTYSLDSFRLLLDGQNRQAMAYFFLSPLVSLTATAVGYFLCRSAIH